ncbi:MAG: hypothetical protein RLZZ299_1249 [Pseudomonadota bacterium]
MPALLYLLLACAPAPLPLPSESGAAAVDRAAEPALYRALYDYAFLPETQDAEQRVRLLIWLRHLGFNRYQLGLLQQLHARVARERAALEQAQEAAVAAHEPEVRAVYDRLWEGLSQGVSEADLERLAGGLDVARAREADLLQLRAQSVRAILDAIEPFGKTLTPRQEALVSDATFALRHRLDPYANPGDFRALVGTVSAVGVFGSLTRPMFDPNEDFLDIGGLWSRDAGRTEQARFPDVQREVVLYMVLLEPMLPVALDAALALRAADEAAAPPAQAAAAGVPGADGAAGAVAPGAAAPGIPEEPAPGIPDAPEPVAPEPPPPAPPESP